MSESASELRRYRRKPEIVDAVQWHKPGDHPKVTVREGVLGEWAELDMGPSVIEPPFVNVGDWIVERADGVACVMTDVDFHRDYEPADAAMGPGEATAAVAREMADVLSAAPLRRPRVELSTGRVGSVPLATALAFCRECGIEVEP